MKPLSMPGTAATSMVESSASLGGGSALDRKRRDERGSRCTAVPSLASATAPTGASSSVSARQTLEMVGRVSRPVFPGSGWAGCWTCPRRTSMGSHMPPVASMRGSGIGWPLSRQCLPRSRVDRLGGDRGPQHPRITGQDFVERVEKKTVVAADGATSAALVIDATCRPAT